LWGFFLPVVFVSVVVWFSWQDFVANLSYSVLTIPCSNSAPANLFTQSGLDGGRTSTVRHWYGMAVMFSRKLDRYLLGVFFMFMACKGWAEPSLQGIALHRELGQDQFLGALYTDIASDDVEVILDARIAKRMELKVVARSGIVAGRFSRMWIEGAAINNSIELLTEQADNMLIFDQMFRGRLEENDHIVID